RLVGMERDSGGEDGLAMLDGDDAPRGEALSVADAVDLVDDRDLGVAAQHEIRVHRMRRPSLHGAQGGDQRLANHLAAEHPLPARLRRAAAKQVHLELFQIKDGEKVLDGGGHGRGQNEEASTVTTAARAVSSLNRGNALPTRAVGTKLTSPR